MMGKDKIMDILNDAHIVFNPMRYKIIQYLKDKPGSNKYDMSKELGVDHENLIFNLLNLTISGILKQDIEQMENPPGKEGLFAVNIYTLDTNKLEKTKKGLRDYLSVL